MGYVVIETDNPKGLLSALLATDDQHLRKTWSMMRHAPDQAYWHAGEVAADYHDIQVLELIRKEEDHG